MELKRFLIRQARSTDYVATVYAERFEEYAGRDSFTGARGGHFYIGDTVIGSADLTSHTVGDSTGRMQADGLAVVSMSPPPEPADLGPFAPGNMVQDRGINGSWFPRGK